MEDGILKLIVENYKKEQCVIYKYFRNVILTLDFTGSNSHSIEGCFTHTSPTKSECKYEFFNTSSWYKNL